MYHALLAIYAPSMAKLLQEFTDFMPPGIFENYVIPEWNWFMDDKNSSVIDQLDFAISNAGLPIKMRFF